MIRAVIDTNALVSGLLSPAGNEALIILSIHQGLVHPCVSDEILEEYAEVLARPKFAFGQEEVDALLAMMRGKGELIAAQGSTPVLLDMPVLSDVSDAKFLQCAIATQAEYIVTGNKRHFPQDACGMVRVVGASELLDRITLEI